jgi:hypothetical protein
MGMAARLHALHRGPLLAELEDPAGWVVAARKRLSSKWVDGAERLGIALEKGRAFTVAAALYERVLEMQPGSEKLRAGLARCDYASARVTGERAERTLSN